MRQYVVEIFLEELLVQALKKGDGLRAIQDGRAKVMDDLITDPTLTAEERDGIYKHAALFFNSLEAHFHGKNTSGFSLDPYLRKDSALTHLQRIILLIGFLIVAGFWLRPPYQWEQEVYLINLRTVASYKTGTQIVAIGHHWIWGPPEGWTAYAYEGSERTIHVARIDWARLGIYVALTIAVCAFLIFASKGSRLTKKGLTQ